jgi:hypothetical protein
MDNIWRNVLQASTGHNVLPLCKVQQSLGCITVLEESRTTTIAGNKVIIDRNCEVLPIYYDLLIVMFVSIINIYVEQNSQSQFILINIINIIR